MTMYTFHMCNADGGSNTFEAFELDSYADVFPKAGRLLMEHPSAVYVEVWAGERPVLSRHRLAPYRRRFSRQAAGLRVVE